MPSEVSICNKALLHLGEDPISSLTEASKAARLCNQLYADERDFVLRAHPWGFAERYVTLAVLADVTPIGFDFAYQYPSNCIKARNIYQPVAGSAPINFRPVANDGLNRKEIWTSQEDAVLVYTVRITAVSLFDAAFIQALSYKLAAELAMPLTKDLKKFQAMIQVYAVYVSEGAKEDAEESADDSEVGNVFLNARS